jgi:hypothetical protein
LEIPASTFGSKYFLSPLAMALFAVIDKSLFQAAQKAPSCEARDGSTSEGVLFAVRCSEAIERNEADEAFSAA